MNFNFGSFILKFIEVVAVVMVVLCIWGEVLEHLSKAEKAYNSFYNKVVKRAFDIVISGTALFFLWPMYLLIALIIMLEDGLPVLYHADRGGYHNNSFRICKFRSMVKNADKIGGGTTALNDPRITKTGSILRKTKCDEIPQLGQVLMGKMSLIGPRPELLRYTGQYEGDNEDILKVRPGITDYSSVEFINLDEVVGGENADEMYEKYVLEKKNALRVKYARTVSFHTDVYILFKTLAEVWKKIVRFIKRTRAEEAAKIDKAKEADNGNRKLGI